MTWIKLDDGFFTNPKVLGLGQAAKLYHLAALTYCARELTDGVIPVSALTLIAGMAGVRGRCRRCWRPNRSRRGECATAAGRRTGAAR